MNKKLLDYELLVAKPVIQDIYNEFNQNFSHLAPNEVCEVLREELPDVLESAELPPELLDDVITAEQDKSEEATALLQLLSIATFVRAFPEND